MIHIYATQNQGARTNQEDTFLAITAATQPESPPTHLLAAVFDGMGGLEAGDKASQAVARTLKQRILEKGIHPTVVTNALREASAAITVKNPKSGTTATVVTHTPQGTQVYHAGDSRAYLLAPNCPPRTLTIPHTLHHQLSTQNRLDLIPHYGGVAKAHATLTNAIGVTCGVNVTIDTLTVTPPDCVPYWRILLASDGFWHHLTDANLEVLANSAWGDLPSYVDQLILVSQTGGRPEMDNQSIVLAHIDNPPVSARQ